MRIIAPMMILIMMTSTLAGCTGGDPDSGGNDNIDMDVINSLVDDNLQDFINNTTITVNNHYHNNTTIVNNDNSNTNISGTSSLLGNGSSNGIIRTIDFVFNLDYLWGNSPIIPGDRTNNYTTTWNYYDYPTNSERTDIFTFDCGIYYLVGSANSSNEQTYWENSNYYDDAWIDLGFNSTIRDMMHNYVWSEDFRWICDDNYFGPEINDNSYYSENIFSVTIPEGYAVKLLCGSEQIRAYSRDNNQSLFQHDQHLVPHFDGVPLYCGYHTDYMGGSSDFELMFSHNYLMVTKEYRILVSYELIPVIAWSN
jgi:hypothetical protein